MIEYATLGADHRHVPDAARARPVASEPVALANADEQRPGGDAAHHEPVLERWLGTALDGGDANLVSLACAQAALSRRSCYSRGPPRVVAVPEGEAVCSAEPFANYL